MVDLPHNMGMRVNAEGVEERSQLCLICEMGADEVQGFLLGQPGPEPSARSDFKKNGISKADDQISFDTWSWLLAERS